MISNIELGRIKSLISVIMFGEFEMAYNKIFKLCLLNSF